jgi:ADP-heptose:LPS heptosyltransferase
VAVVLAYRALGLGDFLTGVPALRALARAHPDAHLVLAAPPALAPLAELSGAVDELVDTAPLGPPPRGADLAVNLHGKGPQSTERLRAARPGRLIAFGGEAARWRAGEHEVVRWCRLLEAHGIPADPRDLDLPRPPSPIAPGATVIHPGAASAAWRWPGERFAAVARAERAAGRRVVITGSAGERAAALTVAEHPEEVLAGETGLLELAGVVAHAGRVVCGDTGLAHLATAFGTPSVVLFGPTPPSEWGPPPDRAQHVALWAGRRGDPHADRPHAGLLELTVDDVLDAVRAQSGSNPSAVAGTSRACMLRSINCSEAAARSASMCATASGATATSKWRT